MYDREMIIDVVPRYYFGAKDVRSIRYIVKMYGNDKPLSR